MRYLKMLGLAAVSAVVLAAIVGAGTASATVFCSTTLDECPAGQKWPAGTIMDWSLTKETSANIVDTKGESLDTCKVQTKEWEITHVGSTKETVTGEEKATTWQTCTFPTKMLSFPTWEVHKIAGTSNGTITTDADSEKGRFELTINTIIFGSCIYGAKAGTDVGDITEGNPAILHTNAVIEKFSGSNSVCPETAKLAATLQLTLPGTTTLSVGIG